MLLAALTATSLTAAAQGAATAYKTASSGNPISPCVFCADPTAFEFEGRLYVYGTNDHQQFIANKKTGDNGYGNIKSLVVFSTDDMMNWTFHGTIDVGTVCGNWCGQSWAPSAVWRKTANGTNEFFIYFANGGGSVGVIKSTKSPVGPFTSPRTSAMITHGMPGVDPCNWVFDPGVVIDDSGTGWIAFGGGDPQSTGSKLMPGNSRIAKLKSTMTALDGSAVNLPAPYLFEASELNMMNGRYVYTYNTSWSDRNDWGSYNKRGSNAAPSTCSMCYMVTDNPLDPDAWEYRGEYVPNPGNFGFGYGNNHTHLQKYEGKYYLFYHSSMLEQNMNTGASGFRSIGVNTVTVDEYNQKIDKLTMNTAGVEGIRNLDPFKLQEAETMSTCGGIAYEDFTNIVKASSINKLGNDASKNLQVRMSAGSWFMVRKADFGSNGVSAFTLRAKGTGRLEVRLGRIGARAAVAVDFSSSDFEDYTVAVDTAAFSGVKSVFFVVAEGSNVYLDSWQFTEKTADGISTVGSRPADRVSTFDLQGRSLPGAAAGTSQGKGGQGIVVEQRADGQGRVTTRKHFRR